MELEVFFTIIQQTYSKLVISFMNRKSSCGYATHFFNTKAVLFDPFPLPRHKDLKLTFFHYRRNNK
jgi:hypothetical protein